MDKSSSAKCLLYSDVVKEEPSPTGRGRRSRNDQGVGDILFTNILQLFSIYFFFSITLSLIFYTFFTHDIYPHPHPTTDTHDPRPTTFSYTPCKLVCKCDIYHLFSSSSFALFSPHLHGANFCQSNFSPKKKKKKN